MDPLTGDACDWQQRYGGGLGRILVGAMAVVLLILVLLCLACLKIVQCGKIRDAEAAKTNPTIGQDDGELETVATQEDGSIGRLIGHDAETVSLVRSENGGHSP